MKIQKKDFIEVNFTGRIKDGGIFDSNIKEDLEKMNIEDLDNLNRTKPFIFSIGERMFLPGIDEFLEGKNYLLHASHKEAFSAATAEAMAKGIKPVPHRFFGADDIWPGLTWDSIDQAIEMITNDTYDSQSYRQYLIDHRYTLPQMMESIDLIINNKEK